MKRIITRVAIAVASAAAYEAGRYGTVKALDSIPDRLIRRLWERNGLNDVPHTHLPCEQCHMQWVGDFEEAHAHE